MTSPTDATAATVRQLAADLGFALCGIASAAASEHAEYVRRWLGEGRQGEMDYLARNLEQRLDPAVLVPGARSVICVADRYAYEAPRLRRVPATGRFARYAWGDDYHLVIKKRLHALADELRRRWPGHDYRAAVDTAPVMEREHAARAGMGWIGKHTLLIHPRHGSWFLLGEIVTTLAIEPDEEQETLADHCGTCTRCIDACPTHCIDPAGYKLDAGRCISYLTLEHRGEIDEALQPMMDEWVGGCDVCQEVCPFNKAEEQTTRTPENRMGGHPAYAARLVELPLLAILNWTVEDRQRVFSKSALKRMKLEQVKRNAVIAAGNALAKQPDESLQRRLEELVSDEHESALVRTTCRQVLARLKGAAHGDHEPPAG